MTTKMNTDRFSSREENEFSRIEYQRGASARRAGLSLRDSPYRPGTWRDKSWGAGWSDEDMGARPALDSRRFISELYEREKKEKK
jgi:hypothetical protein